MFRVVARPPGDAAIVVAVAPGRRAVGGDDTLAAFEGFGNYQAKVVGEGWKNENIAPLPNTLLLLAKRITDNTQFNAFDAFDGSLKELQPLEWMLATKVKQMQWTVSWQGFYSRIWQAEETFNIRHHNRWASFTKICLNPPLLCFARCDKLLDASETETLYRPDQQLLPSMKM